MLETILTLLLLLPLMAKHGRKGRPFGLREVRTSSVVTMATTAAQVALSQALTAASTSGPYRCISVIASWRSQELTDADGPLIVGYAHSDYSVTEIKECIEASASIDQGDKVAQERANRLVRVVGTLGQAVDDELNNGAPIKTRLNWLIGIGDTVNAFVYNDGITMSTGALVRINGSLWVKDAS